MRASGVTGTGEVSELATAPIILVPGFWLGAWAWDEVASLLRADGYEVTALTLPGLESKDADRSTISFDDHVDAICTAIEATVYVDTAPGKGALDPSFEGVEKPMVWEEIQAEENLDGLSDEQIATFR